MAVARHGVQRNTGWGFLRAGRRPRQTQLPPSSGWRLGRRGSRHDRKSDEAERRAKMMRQHMRQHAARPAVRRLSPLHRCVARGCQAIYLCCDVSLKISVAAVRSVFPSHRVNLHGVASEVAGYAPRPQSVPSAFEHASPPSPFVPHIAAHRMIRTDCRGSCSSGFRLMLGMLSTRTHS